ncbi:MAG: M48 family metallopeptidase [Deltaproteobacteria bacterium]|nr:M48 family metallopeptidase [Deltaproteobacteria bacterium]
MSDLLSHIRFEPEAQLLDTLFDRFGLDEILDHFIEAGGAGPHYELVLSTQLRLTPLLAPRLVPLMAEVRERLEFAEPIDLFVQPDAEINAFALHTVHEGDPHAISLTSGLVKAMSDDELRFVLGHELGHLAYRHYRARLLDVAVGEEPTGESRLPALLRRRLGSWDRLAELSADRAGFAAAEGRLEPIVSAFFKMASGLGPEHLRFDIEAFLGQLEALQKMKRKEMLASFSHPVTPVRVRALQLFGEADGIHLEDLHAVDTSVGEVARLMEFEASEPLDVNARDLLLSGGLLAAHADGNPVTQDQSELLIHLLLPLCANPEAEVQAIHSAEEARARFEVAAGWFRENAGEERFGIYRQLCHIVGVDGHLPEGEKDFMREVAEALEIPKKAADEILYEVLSGYLQARAAQRRPSFGFDS